MVSPYSSLLVQARAAKAGELVRPKVTAPALRRLVTTGESSVEIRPAKTFSPLVRGMPLTSTFILMVTGTPCSTPKASPRATATSAASASASANSCMGTTTALIVGFTASIRWSADKVASRLEISPLQMESASRCALHFHKSFVTSAPSNNILNFVTISSQFTSDRCNILFIKLAC